MPDPLLVPGALWDEMVPRVERLPRGQLGRQDLLAEDFRLAEDGSLSVFWIPFERLNRHARVVICGLTPGYGQMLEAFTAARDALAAGMDLAPTMNHIGRSASFAGTMRINLVRMLDHLGLAKALDIASAGTLFEDADELVHTTSALRYPVFVGGANYGGNPQVRRTPLLRSYVIGTLGPELAAVSDALIIPLGKAAEGCIRLLTEAGDLDEERCLRGFPHPSGGNGHRVRQFQTNELTLRARVAEWRSSYT